MYHTDVLTERQLDFVADLLPQPHASTGRPAYTNRVLLPGILKVLRSGCRWRDLDNPTFPSDVTHWRRLQFWRSSGLWPIWHFLLNLLAKKDDLDLSVTSLDDSLVPSFAFSDTAGYSGKDHQVGIKVSSVVDLFGLPLGTVCALGNVHDLTLALPTIDQISVGRRKRPKRTLVDKGYDSQVLRRELKKRGIKANIPERRFKKRRKRGRPPRYDKVLGKQRYPVERTHGWLKSFRRLHFRFDYSPTSFEAFLQLAAIVVCVRRLIR